MEITQKERVIARLKEVGYVDNFWAIHNYILRLGDIIYRLSKEGYIFQRQFGEGKERKDFYYYLISTPEMKQDKLFNIKGTYK